METFLHEILNKGLGDQDKRVACSLSPYLFALNMVLQYSFAGRPMATKMKKPWQFFAGISMETNAINDLTQKVGKSVAL
jgi:hypothetical protein